MILKKSARVWTAATLVFLNCAFATGAQQIGGTAPPSSSDCDPRLTSFFTPRRSLLGTYRVCTDPRPLSLIAPSGWRIDALEALDAFTGAGSYDRGAIARLYGGTRAGVAHLWTETAERFESITLISPYPDLTLRQLEPGTLVITWTCNRADPECRIPDRR